MNDDLKASVAEFLGTFTLVFIGAGAGALAGADQSNGGIVAVALAHGFAIMTCVYAWGAVSGCHINPAVTLAMIVTGKIKIPRGIMYIVAQFVGGAAAGFLLLYLVGDVLLQNGETIGSLTKSGDAMRVIVVEAILTGFLLFAVFGSAVAGRNGNAAGLAIGMVIAMDILMGGFLTGASMNPARTFGPALAMSNLSYIWMYLVGPCAGAVIAAVIYDQVMLRPSTSK